MCLLTFVYLLWGNVYLKSLPIFLIGLFASLLWSCKSYLYILDTGFNSAPSFDSFGLYFMGEVGEQQHGEEAASCECDRGAGRAEGRG